MWWSADVISLCVLLLLLLLLFCNCLWYGVQVEECFTIPIRDLLQEDNWTIKEFSSPVFRFGPRVIWGLTGYLLRKFLVEVVQKCNVK
jgi:hypothetical protein